MVHPPETQGASGDPGETEAVNLERYGETEAVNGSLSFDMERPRLIKNQLNYSFSSSSNDFEGKKTTKLLVGRSPRS